MRGEVEVEVRGLVRCVRTSMHMSSGWEQCVLLVRVGGICVLVCTGWCSACWYARVRACTRGSDSGEYRRGGDKREVSRVF